MPSDSALIVVFGAAGVVGRRVCRALVALGQPLAIAGRRAGPLGALAEELPVSALHVADDRDALVRAFTGATVVVNAAGPLIASTAPVLSACMAAGAHYVDVGGEQAAVQAVYERHESEVRHAGVVALPGCGLDSVLGDLAAAWAAAHLVGADSAADGLDAGRAVRGEPAERLADDAPLDDIAIGLVLEHLVLSAGSQRALFGELGRRPLIWCRDRYEAGPSGDHRRFNAAPFGERDGIAYAGSGALTVPRHVAARRVASYLSLTKSAGASAALRLLSRALPFVPRRAGELLAPYADTDADYHRTRFAVVAQVRRDFAAAQIVVGGYDLYRTTAAITAWCASALANRGAGPVGVRAPGELLRAAPALLAIARAADLTIEPSFDNRGINQR